MKAKMVMTETLANQLIETLCCVAISANGGAAFDKKGNSLMTDLQMAKTVEYAKRIFHEILSEWETNGREWEIVEK